MNISKQDSNIFWSGGTEPEILRRMLKLKSQALKVIRAERDEINFKLSLIRLRKHLTAQIGKEFNENLSRQIDAVTFLIETLSGQAGKPEPDFGFNESGD